MGRRSRLRLPAIGWDLADPSDAPLPSMHSAGSATGA
jgi:hypothetical protein